MTIKTGNEMFNTIIGGGYENQRVYMLIISGRLKHLVDKLNVLPNREDIEDGNVLIHRNVDGWKEADSIIKASRSEDKPAIIINEYNEGFNVTNGWGVAESVDHVIAIVPHGDNINLVQFLVLKQRQNIQHGLRYPFIYNIEENKPHI